MTGRHKPPTQGLLYAAIAFAALLAGCATAAPAGARGGTSLPDRARALIEHCPELACTTADVPGCGFSQDVEAGGVRVVRADIECARAGTATACVERRRPVGGEDQTLQNQRLNFRCAGDPLTCVVTGGNALWPAPVATAGATPNGGVSCHAPRRAGPMPTSHSIPGPDTAKAGGITVHATLA
jgi:hypothetical protein